MSFYLKSIFKCALYQLIGLFESFVLVLYFHCSDLCVILVSYCSSNHIEIWACHKQCTLLFVDVLGVAWSAHDGWLATCSIDNSIIVWNCERFPGDKMFIMICCTLDRKNKTEYGDPISSIFSFNMHLFLPFCIGNVIPLYQIDANAQNSLVMLASLEFELDRNLPHYTFLIFAITWRKLNFHFPF